jgi:hypothetical protein
MTKTRIAVSVAAAYAGCVLSAAAQSAALTPEQLQQTIECKRPMDGLSIASAGVPWLTSVKDNAKPFEELEVKAPLKVFGVEAKRIGVFRDWVFAEVPKQSAMNLVKSQKLERLPAESEETYVRFTQGNEGPLIGVFSPNSMIVFGLMGASDKQDETALVGCDYVAGSREELNAEIKQLGL